MPAPQALLDMNARGVMDPTWCRSGIWLRVGTLATKVAGTRLAPNCIPATPVDAFVGEGLAPTLAFGGEKARTLDER